MAKVEIEERAFSEPRLRATVSKYKTTTAVIMGYATLLWRFSQQAGVVEATRQDILSWLDTDRFSRPERAFELLLSADFIRSTPHDETFLISGNLHAVNRVSRRIESARAAANARYHKDESCVAHASRMPYNKTSIQEDRIIPPKPPVGGANGNRISARSREQQAAALVEKTIGVLNLCLTPEEARAQLGEADFKIVTTRHRGSWQVFSDWMHTRTKKVDIGLVERDLRKTYAGLLEKQAKDSDA